VIATCHALHCPPGSAAALFLLARLAGWVAHVLEQRLSPQLIRPRAKFVAAKAGEFER
jgi:citrate synthase